MNNFLFTQPFFKKNWKAVAIYFLVAIVFWFVFVFFFMFSISYLIPMFLDRYLMPGAIALSLVIGMSIDYIIKIQKYRYIIPIIISLLFAVTVKPNITNKRNVEETVDKIKEIRDSNTLVLICPAHFILNFAYYYNIEILFNDFSKNIIKQDKKWMKKATKKKIKKDLKNLNSLLEKVK